MSMRGIYWQDSNSSKCIETKLKQEITGSAKLWKRLKLKLKKFKKSITFLTYLITRDQHFSKYPELGVIPPGLIELQHKVYDFD